MDPSSPELAEPVGPSRRVPSRLDPADRGRGAGADSRMWRWRWVAPRSPSLEGEGASATPKPGAAGDGSKSSSESLMWPADRTLSSARRSAASASAAESAGPTTALALTRPPSRRRVLPPGLADGNDTSTTPASLPASLLLSGAPSFVPGAGGERRRRLASARAARNASLLRLALGLERPATGRDDLTVSDRPLVLPRPARGGAASAERLEGVGWRRPSDRLYRSAAATPPSLCRAGERCPAGARAAGDGARAVWGLGGERARSRSPASSNLQAGGRGMRGRQEEGAWGVLG